MFGRKPINFLSASTEIPKLILLENPAFFVSDLIRANHLVESFSKLICAPGARIPFLIWRETSKRGTFIAIHCTGG